MLLPNLIVLALVLSKIKVFIQTEMAHTDKKYFTTLLVRVDDTPFCLLVNTPPVGG